MTAISYSDLALGWSIDSQTNKRFNIIGLVVVLLLLGLGILLSSIQLPPEERKARSEVPPRIAQFLIEKKKAAPIIEEPKPEPVKPKPKPEPKPKKVEKPRAEQKPLTETEQAAREVAAQSGLLALSNELADLMETEDITAMVGGGVNSSSAASAASSQNPDLLLAQADSGSGGVGSGKMATTVGKTVLSKREVAAVSQSLVKPDAAVESGQKQTEDAARARSAAVRSVESVTLVFDQNKGVLYTLYNRARRKNPGLQGKLVLELTIAPSGKVTQIKVVSSELDDPTLESRILKRIKQFKFGEKDVEQVKVTYPIEFLPS